MRWELATDDQLWNIIENDWYIPESQIFNLVTEALNRNLFDHLIKHLINRYFNRWDNERRYNFYDLYQIGYIGVVVAAKNYSIGKGSFKTFAYINIKTEFSHHKDKIQAEKRKLYENILSLDVQKHDDNEESFLDSVIDEQQDPEKVALSRVYWNEVFSKLSEIEKDVVIMFAEGYSMNEIGRIKGYQGAAYIHNVFHRSLKKINPNYEKRNLKELGLMTMTKGA